MEQKRGKKATPVQREHLIEHLFNDKSLARDKFETIQGKRLQQEKWEHLTQQLNALGGTSKTKAEWKRYWRDLLFRTKARARSLRSGGSGVNGVPGKPLNPEEEKIIAIISSEHIYGNENVTEIGICSDDQESNAAAVANENKAPELDVLMEDNPPAEVEITNTLPTTSTPALAPSTSRPNIIRRATTARRQKQELLDLSRKNMEATERANADIIKLKQEKIQVLRELVAAVNRLSSVAEHLVQLNFNNNTPRN